MTTRKPVILLGGPTASGKSALAMHLAKQLPAPVTIINADALQVYAGLPLLSAQPDAASKAQCPHQLYGTVPATTHFSAALWREAAVAALQAAHREGHTPIIVGGTGLYLKVLQQGIAKIPPIPAITRATVAEQYKSWGEAKFRAALAAVDPEAAARIAPNDQQRLCRAYEVYVATNRSLTAWQTESTNAADVVGLRWYRLLTNPERATLYAACDQRATQMLEGGAIAEVEKFLAQQVPLNLPIWRTIGAEQIAAYLQQKTSLPDALTAMQQATRNYAKRQLTWFRHQWQPSAAAPLAMIDSTNLQENLDKLTAWLR